MLNFIPTHDQESTLAIRASGKLSHEDYQTFLPQLEEKIEQFGQVSLLLELDNFSGWDLKAAKDDFKFAFKHMGDLDRIAIVGDKAWEHWMTMMAKPFMLLGKVRYFDRERLQEAWDWLREKENLEVAAETLLPYKGILVPVDFSLASIHACKRGIELAKQYGAKLTLLYVAQDIIYSQSIYETNLDTGDTAFSYPLDYELSQELTKQKFEMLNHQMDGFIDHLEADMPIQSSVTTGDIKGTILSYAEAQNTSLIIFGLKKKKGIKSILGTIPHFIQNHANCEVLLVPLVTQNSDTFS
jgi:universal stress protein A